MRFGAFDRWGVSGTVKFLSISVTLGFCAHYICGLPGPLHGLLECCRCPHITVRKRDCYRGLHILPEAFPWGLLFRDAQTNMDRRHEDQRSLEWSHGSHSHHVSF